MPHLLNQLVTGLYYAYHMTYRPSQNIELLDPDNIHRLGANTSIRKPNYMYSDYGFVMTADQLRTEQDAVDYPLVYTPEEEGLKFSVDKVVRNVTTYIVVPVVATTEVSSLKQYWYTVGANPEMLPLVPMYWDEAKFQAFKGSELEANEGEYFNFPLGTSKSNPGIIYLAYPYFGPKEGDPDYVEKYWDIADNIPALFGKFDTGGRTPQTVEIGNSFMKASNKNKIPTTYIKQSLVRQQDGEYKTICHKTCNLLIDSSSQEDVFLRISLTRPFPNDISMDINYQSNMELTNGITSPLVIDKLSDVYGLTIDDFHQYSVRRAARATLSGSTIVKTIDNITIPAGTIDFVVPFSLKGYVGRYFTEIAVENISNRDNVKLLNNGILISVSDGSIDEDLSKQGLYYSMDIYENGRKIDSFNIGETNYMNVDGGRVYEAVVTVNCLDFADATLRARYNQPISSSFQPSKRHLFTKVELKNDQGLLLNSSIEMIGTGEYNLMMAEATEQQFKFPVNLGTSVQELTLSLANLVTTTFNGKKDIGTYTGFTFRKV